METDLDMSFNFRSQFLEMFNDRAIDCSSQISMLVGNGPSLVSYVVKDILR